MPIGTIILDQFSDAPHDEGLGIDEEDVTGSGGCKNAPRERGHCRLVAFPLDKKNKPLR